MVDQDTLLEIKKRDGVVGLIMAQYQLNDGIRFRHTRNFEQSLEVICKHIDKVADLTGSHRHIALGTDFDGFIKPTMSGLEDMGDLRKLETELRKRYAAADVDMMTSGNALRVLRSVWT
jgi:microsomal dipeptidase-like Zn-dependent dipeptidase